MKTLIGMILMVATAMAAPVDPRQMKAGESACVFPFHHTEEGNVWVSPGSVTSGKFCVFVIRRGHEGWTLYLDGVPAAKRQAGAHDADMKRFGWLNLGPGVKVLAR